MENQFGFPEFLPSAATFVCGEVRTGSELSLGTEQGCFMGSWCSQVRQEWGQGAFHSPVFQHLPSVIQEGGEEPSQPAVGERLNSNGFFENHYYLRL